MRLSLAGKGTYETECSREGSDEIDCSKEGSD